MTADSFDEDEVVGFIISIAAPGKKLWKMHICNESISADYNDSNPYCAFYVVYFCCWKLTQCQRQSSLLELLELVQQIQSLISLKDLHHSYSS